MSTWEERMGLRASIKRGIAEAEEFLAEIDPRQERWTAFVRAREGFSAGVYECARDCSGVNGGWTFFPPLGNEPEHNPHIVFSHAHYFHGNVIADAVTKECIPGAVFSVALSDDMPPRPSSCPICDDFKPEEWTP